MTDTQTHRPRLTLFDLDHTLLPIDSDYEWGAFTIRIGWNDPVECASAGPRRLPPPMRSSCAR